MPGHISGVQKRLSAEEPKSMFVHCANHSLDLVIQEVAKRCDLIADSLMLVKVVSNAILESSKRKNIYSGIVLPPFTEDSIS
ncbi:hypothetical protein R5R35_013551 [Gryllus longicercus]|uniref:Uncharacterized protein n=1 Tax=Gryllus longicercus TaxID=2509291 RepID=A0AAN9YZR3_9ORTH